MDECYPLPMPPPASDAASVGASSAVATCALNSLDVNSSPEAGAYTRLLFSST